MSHHSTHVPFSGSKLKGDFWKFWVGQTISNLGSSFTLFAIPLLVYKLTGSALSLATASASSFLPYVLFGLVIGAWVDRLNRKQVMIAADLGRSVIIASIPLLNSLGALSLWWIYAAAFINTTLSIFFNTAQFAAIPSLVDRDDLVTANGRIQASYSAASVLGPLLGGVLATWFSIPTLLLFDVASFPISALSLALISTSFNASTKQKSAPTSLRQEIAEGLDYVLHHPVLRSISLMMALINFVNYPIGVQLVLFAGQRFQASDSQTGVLFAAGSVGIIILSLVASPLRKRFSLGNMALGTLIAQGLLTIIMAISPWYWPVVFLWSMISGLGILFNITTGSLRQAIVPNHLLGRVMSIAMVLAWSAIPLGTLISGWLIEQVQDVSLVYGGIGMIVFLIGLGFMMTPVRQAEQYLLHQ